jgi:hypothetical protein
MSDFVLFLLEFKSAKNNQALVERFKERTGNQSKKSAQKIQYNGVHIIARCFDNIDIIKTNNG